MRFVHISPEEIMSLDDQRSRRAVLRLGGSAAIAAVLAGCGDGGPGGGGEGNETEEEENATGGTGEEENATEGEENATGEGNETEGGGGGSGAIEPDTEIMLGGETQGWQGQEPEEIADEENPTLPLQEGESYEITWENLDGQEHNLQILDDSDEVVDDYETELMGEEGETQTLQIDEVTSEMARYICEPHQGTMNGDIEVQ